MGAAYQRARRDAIAAEPWCHRAELDFGMGKQACPHPDAGTPANPLTGDHVVPRRLGGSDELVVLCLRCNAERGSRPLVAQGGGVIARTTATPAEPRPSVRHTYNAEHR